MLPNHLHRLVTSGLLPSPFFMGANTPPGDDLDRTFLSHMTRGIKDFFSEVESSSSLYQKAYMIENPDDFPILGCREGISLITKVYRLCVYEDTLMGLNSSIRHPMMDRVYAHAKDMTFSIIASLVLGDHNIEPVNNPELLMLYTSKAAAVNVKLAEIDFFFDRNGVLENLTAVNEFRKKESFKFQNTAVTLDSVIANSDEILYFDNGSKTVELDQFEKLATSSEPEAIVRAEANELEHQRSLEKAATIKGLLEQAKGSLRVSSDKPLTLTKTQTVMTEQSGTFEEDYDNLPVPMEVKHGEFKSPVREAGNKFHPTLIELRDTDGKLIPKADGSPVLLTPGSVHGPNARHFTNEGVPAFSGDGLPIVIEFSFITETERMVPLSEQQNRNVTLLTNGRFSNEQWEEDLTNFDSGIDPESPDKEGILMPLMTLEQSQQFAQNQNNDYPNNNASFPVNSVAASGPIYSAEASPFSGAPQGGNWTGDTNMGNSAKTNGAHMQNVHQAPAQSTNPQLEEHNFTQSIRAEDEQFGATVDFERHKVAQNQANKLSTMHPQTHGQMNVPFQRENQDLEARLAVMEQQYNHGRQNKIDHFNTVKANTPQPVLANNQSTYQPNVAPVVHAPVADQSVGLKRNKDGLVVCPHPSEWESESQDFPHASPEPVAVETAEPVVDAAEKEKEDNEKVMRLIRTKVLEAAATTREAILGKEMTTVNLDGVACYSVLLRTAGFSAGRKESFDEDVIIDPKKFIKILCLVEGVAKEAIVDKERFVQRDRHEIYMLDPKLGEYSASTFRKKDIELSKEATGLIAKSVRYEDTGAETSSFNEFVATALSEAEEKDKLTVVPYSFDEIISAKPVSKEILKAVEEISLSVDKSQVRLLELVTLAGLTKEVNPAIHSFIDIRLSAWWENTMQGRLTSCTDATLNSFTDSDVFESVMDYLSEVEMAEEALALFNSEVDGFLNIDSIYLGSNTMPEEDSDGEDNTHEPYVEFKDSQASLSLTNVETGYVLALPEVSSKGVAMGRVSPIQNKELFETILGAFKALGKHQKVETLLIVLSDGMTYRVVRNDKLQNTFHITEILNDII